MSQEYKRFVAAGKSLEIVKQFLADREAAFQKRFAFLNRMGTKTYYGSNQGIIGLVYADGNTIPDGLRKKTKSGKTYYVPNTRAKAGKALQKEINGLSLPDAWTLSSRLKFDAIAAGMKHNGRLICHASLEVFGDTYVIGLPAYATTVPADAVPLKQSEYWKMKEDAESSESKAS